MKTIEEITYKLSNGYELLFVEGNIINGCQLPSEVDYNLIGTSIDLTLDECIYFMPVFHYWGKNRYKDYLTNTYSLDFSALDSFNSLKASLGVDTNRKYIVLIKKYYNEKQN